MASSGVVPPDSRPASPSELLAAVTAAVLVSEAALAQLRLSAQAARGAGVGWADLGHALNLPAGILKHAPDMSLADAAWGFVVEGVRPGQRPVWHQGFTYISWDCTTCQRPVCETGPRVPHPALAEEGHAPDCARHLADIAHYEG